MMKSLASWSETTFNKIVLFAYYINAVYEVSEDNEVSNKFLFSQWWVGNGVAKGVIGKRAKKVVEPE